MVEADGEWHTSDNSYASDAWRASHPPVLPETLLPPTETASIASSATAVNEPPNTLGKDKTVSSEVFVLDSDDDDDEGQVKQQLSPSFRSSNGSFEAGPPDSQVIDLTLSDDEDVAPRRKRKATDSPTQPIWKKSRGDEGHGLDVGNANGNVHALAPDLPHSGSNNVGSPYLNGTLSQSPASPRLPSFESFTSRYVLPFPGTILQGDGTPGGAYNPNWMQYPRGS